MFKLKFLKAVFMLVVAFVTIGGTVSPALAGQSAGTDTLRWLYGSGSATGGKVISLRVTLWTEAAAGGAVVKLASNNPVITVPATATIPAGSTQTIVKVKTLAVHENTPVTITATYKNRVRTKQILILRPYLSSTTIQSRIRSGGLARFTVRLSGIAPEGGVTVRFNSNRPSAVPVPATLYFPAGKASVTYIATGAVVHRDVELNISAKYRGITITKPTILRKARVTTEDPGTGGGVDQGDGGNDGSVDENPDGGSDNGDGGNTGENPGGDNPGGDVPGGDNPGGDNPGGDTGTGDGTDQGDNQGGDDQGDNTGGDDQGDNQNGDDQGDNTGGDQNGGDQGGDTGNQDGGNEDGGSNDGGLTGGGQGDDQNGDTGGDQGGDTGGDDQGQNQDGNDQGDNQNGDDQGQNQDGDDQGQNEDGDDQGQNQDGDSQGDDQNGDVDNGTGDEQGDNGQGGDEQTNPGGGQAGEGDNGSTDEQPVVVPDSESVTVCHATGKGTYRLVTANAAGIYNGHYGDHDDIIPAFTYQGVTYAPQGDQSILTNGCVAP